MTARRVLAPMTLVLGFALVLLGGLTPASATPAHQASPHRVPNAPSGPDELGASLDRLLKKQLDEYDIPGAAVSVVSRDKQLMARGYGVPDADRKKQRVDPERTGFFMGSVTKVLTAIAVLQLVEDGKVDLRADVNKYLKTFQIKDKYPGKPVTPHHLLTHTAGFDFSIVGTASEDPEDAGDLGESLEDNQPERVREPGEAAAYDNYGVALAGYVVEQVTGKPFEEYVQQQIFDPLGMSRTTLDQPHPKQVEEALARGHRPSDGGQETAKGQYGAWTPTGAAAVSTATDMGRLMRALLSEGRLADKRVLGEKAAKVLEKRQYGNDKRLPGMAYMLEERRHDEHRYLVKDGDIPGFHTNMALFPDKNLGVYVSYNGDGDTGKAALAADEVAELAADHVYGGKAEGTSKSTLQEDIGQYEGSYRANRTSHSDFTRASALTGSIEVSAGDDGVLTTNGPLSADPDVTEQKWRQIERGLFQEVDGDTRIAFEDGRLTVSTDTTVAFTKVAWYESPKLHMQLLIGGLALISLTMICWPIIALVRRSRDPRPGPRAARLLAWANSLLLGGVATCFALLVADSNVMNQTVFLGDSPLLTAVPTLLAASGVATAAMLCCAVLAYHRRWWGWVSRLHYSLTGFAAVIVLMLAGNYALWG
ncbi:class A beta-lactamase-related serine hydrolase [Streptomyces armeniacus]|uniref:Class A beta-lactamase-related serine hydrolase n=1 Tax=Streptomyces armeniacus TaxID=83291 RepID=A0A345XPI6_9ACTN|nr:serine hydrolase domain-containing protein [Streptomyces armeniacus]AXK33552.1 class A beta-lactamase-related serine hydrolase [Streptomyces armeniacus]